jgi:hypothetical protein
MSEDQLQPYDTLDDRGVEDVLDEGYSPPEKLQGSRAHGTTPAEVAEGETLEQRIAQEEPEPDPYEEAARDALTENEPEGFVGDERAGRLTAPDEGVREDAEKDLVAQDHGIDGAAAGAEEAAVHVIEDDEIDPTAL